MYSTHFQAYAPLCLEFQGQIVCTTNLYDIPMFAANSAQRYWLEVCQQNIARWEFRPPRKKIFSPPPLEIARRHPSRPLAPRSLSLRDRPRLAFSIKSRQTPPSWRLGLPTYTQAEKINSIRNANQDCNILHDNVWYLSPNMHSASYGVQQVTSVIETF